MEIPESRVAEEFDKKYRDLAKKSKIKGFRPGKVPRSIIKSYYGKAVEHEVSSQFIQETFPEALKETDLKPLTQADVSESHFEENGSFSYTALVDICPPFELPVYKGLKIHKPPVEVTDEQIQAELDRLRPEPCRSFARLKSERPIRKETWPSSISRHRSADGYSRRARQRISWSRSARGVSIPISTNT